MAYHIQIRTGRTTWKLSMFAKRFDTADEAWRYCATLDQDACIPPDTRVVDHAGHVQPRPNAFAFQAEIMGF